MPGTLEQVGTGGHGSSASGSGYAGTTTLLPFTRYGTRTHKLDQIQQQPYIIKWNLHLVWARLTWQLPSRYVLHVRSIRVYGNGTYVRADTVSRDSLVHQCTYRCTESVHYAEVLRNLQVQARVHSDQRASGTDNAVPSSIEIGPPPDTSTVLMNSSAAPECSDSFVHVGGCKSPHHSTSTVRHHSGTDEGRGCTLTGCLLQTAAQANPSSRDAGHEHTHPQSAAGHHVLRRPMGHTKARPERRTTRTSPPCAAVRRSLLPISATPPGGRRCERLLHLSHRPVGVMAMMCSRLGCAVVVWVCYITAQGLLGFVARVGEGGGLHLRAGRPCAHVVAGRGRAVLCDIQWLSWPRVRFSAYLLQRVVGACVCAGHTQRWVQCRLPPVFSIQTRLPNLWIACAICA